MHELTFLRDLALVMCIAGGVTVLFHLLKQPVVLGYILAGVIVGPHTSTSFFISNEHTIKLLSELGVILLMFSLGLEFSLRKLKKVGIGAFIIAAFEILGMIWIGYEIGMFFGWGKMNSTFLGALLSISSTTIIAKALEEQGKRKESFTELVFGILIVEDILAILMLALLSGYASTGSLHGSDIVTTVGKITLFLVTLLISGLLAVPRLINFIARFKNNEMLLVAVLGICFGISLLTVKMGYSVALGAFLIGAVMAESRHIATIETLVQPVRDMFSALFFVSIGLMIDPVMIYKYSVPIIIISMGVIGGKIVTSSFGAFITGNSLRTSLRTGMSLAQIGEFSFIIAGLGLQLKVTDNFLYPMAVAVSALTTLFTPYLIKASDPLANAIEKHAPPSLLEALSHYTAWLQSLKSQKPEATVTTIIKTLLWKIILNLLIMIAIFLGGALAAEKRWPVFLTWIPGGNHGTRIAVWLACIIISMPILVTVYRKLKALSHLISELVVPAPKKEADAFVRAAVLKINKWICKLGLSMLLLVLSSTILPPNNFFITVTICILLGGYFFRDRLSQIHDKAQTALAETFEEKDNIAPVLTHQPIALIDFSEFTVSTITILSTSPAVGKLISELQLKSSTEASIIGIQRHEHIILQPGNNEELRAGDNILLLGNAESINKATMLLNKS